MLSISRHMKNIRSKVVVFVVLATLFLQITASSQVPQAPEINYEPVPGFLDLPAGMNFGEVSGIAVNSKSHIYVFHRGDHSLMEFDPDGKFVRALGDGLFENPHGLRIDEDDSIWTTDLATHLVLKLSPEGKVLMVLGKRGMAGEWLGTALEKLGYGGWTAPSNMPLFDQPSDIAFGADGSVFISDGYGNSRVMKFDKEGKFLTGWGVKGDKPGQFSLPHGIVVDSKGRVYVADRENKRIQIFDSKGGHLATWDHVGYPYGLAFSPDQKLFVTDARAERVLVLDLEGKILGFLGKPGKSVGEFGWAHGIAVGPKNELYVTEVLNWRVQKFVPRNSGN